VLLCVSITITSEEVLGGADLVYGGENEQRKGWGQREREGRAEETIRSEDRWNMERSIELETAGNGGNRGRGVCVCVCMYVCVTTPSKRCIRAHAAYTADKRAVHGCIRHTQGRRTDPAGACERARGSQKARIPMPPSESPGSAGGSTNAPRVCIAGGSGICRKKFIAGPRWP
jgi:hypothetical protein